MCIVENVIALRNKWLSKAREYHCILLVWIEYHIWRKYFGPWYLTLDLHFSCLHYFYIQLMKKHNTLKRKPVCPLNLYMIPWRQTTSFTWKPHAYIHSVLLRWEWEILLPICYPSEFMVHWDNIAIFTYVCLNPKLYVTYMCIIIINAIKNFCCMVINSSSNKIES